MSFRTFNLSVTLVFVLFLTGNLFAHSPGFSTATLTVGKDRIDALVTFSREEVESLIGRSDFPNLNSLAMGVLRVGNEPPTHLEIHTDAGNDFIFRLSFSNSNLDRLEIRSPLIADLNPGHRQYLLARDDRHELLLSKLLKSDESSATIEAFVAPVSNESEEDNTQFGIRVFFVFSAFLGVVIFSMILFWAAIRFRCLFEGGRITISILAASLFSAVLYDSSTSPIIGNPPPPVLVGANGQTV